MLFCSILVLYKHVKGHSIKLVKKEIHAFKLIFASENVQSASFLTKQTKNQKTNICHGLLYCFTLSVAPMLFVSQTQCPYYYKVNKSEFK